MARRKWTPEQRAAQAAAIHAWRPWEASRRARTSAADHQAKAPALMKALRHLARIFDARTKPANNLQEQVKARE